MSVCITMTNKTQKLYPWKIQEIESKFLPAAGDNRYENPKNNISNWSNGLLPIIWNRDIVCDTQECERALDWSGLKEGRKWLVFYVESMKSNYKRHFLNSKVNLGSFGAQLPNSFCFLPYFSWRSSMGWAQIHSKIMNSTYIHLYTIHV